VELVQLNLKVSGIATFNNINVTGVSTFATTIITNVSSSGIITASQLSTGSTNGIGINTSTISGPAEIIIDPATVGDDTGSVKIKGNLVIEGDTYVNSDKFNVESKTIGIASVCCSR